MEWSYRRRCGIFGRNWYSLDYRLDEFIPFRDAFEARRRESDLKSGRTYVGEIVRSFIFEFELEIAENQKEEAALIQSGSLVVFSKPRFGRRQDWWSVIGSGKNFLADFKPYQRPQSALNALKRERAKGKFARLASWRIRRLTSDKQLQVSSS